MIARATNGLGCEPRDGVRIRCDHPAAALIPLI